MHIFPLGLLKTILSLMVKENPLLANGIQDRQTFLNLLELNTLLEKFPRTPELLHISRIINSYTNKKTSVVCKTQFKYSFLGKLLHFRECRDILELHSNVCSVLGKMCVQRVTDSTA